MAQSDLGARFSLPALSYPPLPLPFRLLHLVHQLLLQFLLTSSAHTLNSGHCLHIPLLLILFLYF